MCESKWESVLNSRIMANYFKELCKDFSPPYREMSFRMNLHKAGQSNDIIFVLTQTERLITEGKIDEETFKEEIKKIKDLKALHVEVLWYMEVCKVMTLLEFLEFHENNNNLDMIQHIAQQIFESLLEQKANPLKVRNEMLQSYIGTILECSKQGSKPVSFFQTQINLIITNLKQVYAAQEGFDIDRCIDMSQLSEMLNNFEPDLIKNFLKTIIMRLLESASHITKFVFKKQEKLKNNIKDKKIYQFFMTMLKHCDLKFMIELLETMLLNSGRDNDWDHMLCFITFVGVEYKDGWNCLKMLTNLIIKDGLQKLDEKLLLYGFLIARQGCFEKSNKCFPSYVQWFSSTFSAESKRPINSKKICSFFVSFLTDLFAYDLTYYSKVHINRAPWVPAEIQSILHDYIDMVKTQLSDLNVSTELGICDNTTNKSAAEFDVENVLKHFERTNDILQSVFQTAMFCKDYYEKKFLRELLSKFEGKKSVRHRFIVRLHALGKIPNSVFKVYKALEKKSNKNV